MKYFKRALLFFLAPSFIIPTVFFSVSHAAMTEGMELGVALPLWSVLPFVGILLSLALIPLIAPRFWHHHFPKVSAFWALVFAIPFLFFFREQALHEIA